VVNVVILGALAQGRPKELASVLENAGSGLYLQLARAIIEPPEKLVEGDDKQLRTRLERDARVALTLGQRRLRRHAWLDSFAIVAIAYAGVAAVVGEPPTLVTTLGLVAATLLWSTNVRWARSLGSQLYSGGMALVDMLVASAEQIRANWATSPALKP
jgi:hypothetical protein